VANFFQARPQGQGNHRHEPLKKTWTGKRKKKGVQRHPEPARFPIRRKGEMGGLISQAKKSGEKKERGRVRMQFGKGKGAGRFLRRNIAAEIYARPRRGERQVLVTEH